MDVEVCYERAIKDLHRCGVLRDGDRILTRQVLDIECAYIIFDRNRQANLDRLIQYLEYRQIITAGRYGRWDYYSMEDSILSGKAAAERVTACTTVSI
jgi:protoporphyrinogen oxidase